MDQSISIPGLLLRRLLVYLLAVGVAYTLAVMAATQSVVASLGAMGMPVSIGERWSMNVGFRYEKNFVYADIEHRLCRLDVVRWRERAIGRTRTPTRRTRAAAGNRRDPDLHR